MHSLTEDEIDIVRPAFDALFDTAQTCETDKGIELYQRDIGPAEPAAILSGDELGAL